MTNSDVYMYGMTVFSTIHLLKDKFPPADAYQEIRQTFVIPGGEGANGAIVLRNLGVGVRLDGCYLGELTESHSPITSPRAAKGDWTCANISNSLVLFWFCAYPWPAGF